VGGRRAAQVEVGVAALTLTAPRASQC